MTDLSIELATTARDEEIVVASVQDLGLQQPPRRVDVYRPAPDYWRVVQARRPVPYEVVETLTSVPVQLASIQTPPLRLAEMDGSFFDDWTNPTIDEFAFH